MSDNQETIEKLIAAGLLIAVGYGVYRVLKSFASFQNGAEITRDDVSGSLDSHKVGASDNKLWDSFAKKYVHDPIGFFKDGKIWDSFSRK